MDRPFLRTLFSVVEEFHFNIEVFEYAIRNSYHNKRDIAIDTSIENRSTNECYDKNDNLIKEKNNKYNNEKLRVEYENGVAYNVETEKRYLNIADITDMKSIGFYHNLVKEIENLKDKTHNRIYYEEGYINIYDKKEREEKMWSEKEGFFRINNKCIWYDKTKMETDIELLLSMSCKIKVIGYMINCLEKRQDIIIKALAMYIKGIIIHITSDGSL